MSMVKSKFKKGQKVRVISGSDKGKMAEIKQVIRSKKMVILEGLNIRKKHQKAATEQGEGQIVDKEMPLYWSKVMVVEK